MSQQQSSQVRSEPAHSSTYNFIRDSSPMNPHGSVYQPPISSTAATTTNAQQSAPPADANATLAAILGWTCCTGTIVLCCGAFVLAFSLISVGIAIAEIVMGQKYITQCPAEPGIPSILFLAGILGLVPTILSVLTVLAACCISAERKANSKVIWLIDLILRGVSAIAHFLLIILLIYLIFITFSIFNKVQYIHSDRTKTYCHKRLYHFTLFIAVYNIINAVVVCCGGSASGEKPKKAETTG
jgi:hypothetical protein